MDFILLWVFVIWKIPFEEGDPASVQNTIWFHGVSYPRFFVISFSFVISPAKDQEIN
jgi:hypothetical protein